MEPVPLFICGWSLPTRKGDSNPTWSLTPVAPLLQEAWFESQANKRVQVWCGWAGWEVQREREQGGWKHYCRDWATCLFDLCRALSLKPSRASSQWPSTSKKGTHPTSAVVPGPPGRKERVKIGKMMVSMNYWTRNRSILRGHESKSEYRTTWNMD